MKKIDKTHSFELDNFIQQEKQKNVTPVYEGGLDSKEEYKDHFFKIREQLAKEQGYICCYCQDRIEIKKNELPAMRLEHFKPKSKFEELELDYTNMLAACVGNSNGETHCDQCKGSEELKGIPNPSSSEFLRFKLKYIHYKQSRQSLRKESDYFVEIHTTADDEEMQNAIQGKKAGCLNLNHQTLKSKRGNVWKGIANVFYRQCGENWHNDKGKSLAHRLLETYKEKNVDGYYRPFCQVMIDLLKKEFKLP